MSGKLFLKSNSKMLLNDRFKLLRQTTTRGVQVQGAQKRQFSKNRRLAQQLANRPTVLAALKLKRRSIHQRIGGPATREQPQITKRQNWRPKQDTQTSVASGRIRINRNNQLANQNFVPTRQFRNQNRTTVQAPFNRSQYSAVRGQSNYPIQQNVTRGNFRGRARFV